MKRILFLIVFHLSSCLIVYGQSQTTGTSIYKFKVSGYVGFSGSSCGDNITGGLQWIAVMREDGSHATLIQGSASYPNSGNGFGNANYVEEFDFTKTNKVIKVKYHTTRRSETAIGTCRSTSYNYSEHNISICQRVDYGFSGLNQPGNSVETINPIVVLNAPTGKNVNISNEETLLISLPDNIDNQYYNWEFSVGDTNNFVRFPNQFNNVPILNLKGADFLTDADFGKTIFVRVNMQNCAAEPTNSNIIAFTYYKSSPKISSSNFTPTTCFDTTDGTLNLNFERSLITDETLEMVLVNTDTGAAVLNQDLTAILQTQTTHSIQNLAPGNYKVDFIGTYQGNPTYTDSSAHTLSFQIVKPTPVTFSLTAKTDAYCFEGSDGNIILTADGGQGQFQYIVTKDGLPFIDWTNFSNGTMANIQNLSDGVYKIKVRDSNGCVAKNAGIEKEITVTINQPTKAIALSEIDNVQPTGYGLSNGYVSVRVTGGSANANGSYNLEWRKDSPTAAVISAGITTDLVNNPFTILLSNITAGKYYLTVTDKNYASASSNTFNCGIISQEFIVTQPDPLIATIEVNNPISCNAANEDAFKLDLNANGIFDNGEDGILQAKVTGGVGAYSYQWQVLSSGVFVDMPNEKNAILNNFTEGQYKIKVVDVNNNQTEESYTAVFPPKMEIVLSANTIKCNNQNEGQVSVATTGGTGAYSYQWNTGDSTPTVSGLLAGNYFVMVKDQKQCSLKGNVAIAQPDQLAIEEIAVENPVCFGANDGKIEIKVTGGKMPYTILWSNGRTGEKLSGLVAAKYLMTLTDANGCIITQEFTLTDPEKRTVDLGKDITLCLGDSQIYDVTINDAGANYQWKKDGVLFSTATELTLSEAGTYTITITDSKGCVATDEMVVSLSIAQLDPQFLITTFAYNDKNVVLVNTSPIKPEKVAWVIPKTNAIEIVSENEESIELKFYKTGTYELGLKGMQGLCEKTIFKKIVIDENLIGATTQATTASNIKSFTILPNPNDGNYKVLVALQTEANINLRLIDMNARELIQPMPYAKATQFEIPFSYTLASGYYLVVLETGGEVMVKRMLIE